MSNNIFLIVGESGSGKTTVVGELENQFHLKSVKSYTTRPKRYKNEKGHTFVTNEVFHSLEGVCAYTKFDGFEYSATYEQVQCSDLFVIDPEGIEYFVKNYQGKKYIKIIHVTVNEHERYHRMRNRGDSIEVAQERLKYDAVAFKDTKKCVNYIVENYDIQNSVKLIFNFISRCNNDSIFSWALTKNILEYYKYRESNKTKEAINKDLKTTKNKYDKVVYISHPYGGKFSNTQLIEDVIKKLTTIYPSCLFLSPLHSFGYLYDLVDYQTGILYCLWLLDKCDEMWVFGEWEQSKGCNIEIKYCKEQSISYKIKV